MRAVAASCKVRVKREIEEAVQKAKAFKQHLGNRVLQISLSTSSEEGPERHHPFSNTTSAMQEARPPAMSSSLPTASDDVANAPETDSIVAHADDHMDVDSDGLNAELEKIIEESEGPGES